MSNRIGTLTVLALVSSVAACGSSSSTPPAGPGASTQVIRGSIALSAYAVDNPVVVARTADGRSFFAPVQADGTFAVTVPSGTSARLSLANTTRANGYVAISRILWPGTTATWARLDGTTASIALGHVRPVAGGALQTLDHGGSSGGSYDGDSGSSSSGSSGSGGGSSGGSSGDDGDAHEVHACGTAAPGRSDLPYDVRPAVGSTFKLDQAFLAKGPLPAEIVSVTMQGGTWRLKELQADASFVVADADCTHAGNRDVGRDRVFVTWKNADGSTSTDHLDLRYCDGSGTSTQDYGSGGGGGGHDGEGMDPDDCESDGTPICASSDAHDSECDGRSGGMHEDDDDHGDDRACPGGDGGTTPPADGGADAGDGSAADGGTAGGGGGGGTGVEGDACVVNADCIAKLVCVTSRCTAQIK